ncbi:MAG: 1-deoxy-D-xylulose-5-phosphate reductoisomerase [Lachnoclostridium sp.]|jgi:1-deoxy-D-xylulose-5-phosphate reductoisomerase|nr:1-deoxy-D-xylulose-5-phosphate reductoisomerase [Lachnoclostridium sp.]
MYKKTIALLGSTGSIGTQTLEVIRNNPDHFLVYAMAAGKNVDLLEKQVREFEPQIACLEEEKDALDLSKRIQGSTTKVVYGMEGLLACVCAKEVQTVVAAMVGMKGLKPVLTAIQENKDIALANKETLVTAGHLIMPLVREKNVSILPIDSEHSAIFQCLQGLPEPQNQQIDRIYLTASGGPFLYKTKEELLHITVEDALRHPNWMMGKKITIDSATMLNKGLEFLEAKWLFGVESDQIQVLIQPKSIVHSMVGFVDGAVMAQLGSPDMKVPIQYALMYPKRAPLDTQRLDFANIGKIEFVNADAYVKKGLELAYTAGEAGGSMPAVMNAANEFAVDKFLKKQIGFLDIYRMISYAMDHHSIITNPNLEDILEIENETYCRLYDMEKLWRKL